MKEPRAANGTVPFWWFELPKSFFTRVTKCAEEFRLTRPQFLDNAVRHYTQHLRRGESAIAKTLGSTDLAEQFAKASSKAAKDWWSQLSPEERAARAKKASQAAKKARREKR